MCVTLSAIFILSVAPGPEFLRRNRWLIVIWSSCSSLDRGRENVPREHSCLSSFTWAHTHQDVQETAWKQHVSMETSRFFYICKSTTFGYQPTFLPSRPHNPMCTCLFVLYLHFKFLNLWIVDQECEGLLPNRLVGFKSCL